MQYHTEEFLRAYGKPIKDAPEETEVKSYGAIPLDFDKPEETERYAIDLIGKRGFF